jgi:site-specific recombinase XerC
MGGTVLGSEYYPAWRPDANRHSKLRALRMRFRDASRMLFRWLVTGQIVAANPAHEVRGPKHVV